MHHSIVELVEDKPGVLNRVASLFRRRAFNIESLTVGRTDVPGISRMTVVIDSDEVSADRVTAYLYKLVNVLQVEDLRDVPAVARDLALVKVAVAGHDRAQLLRVVDETGAKRWLIILGGVVTAGTFIYFTATTIVNDPATLAALIAFLVLAVVLDLAWKWRRGPLAEPAT